MPFCKRLAFCNLESVRTRIFKARMKLYLAFWLLSKPSGRLGNIRHLFHRGPLTQKVDYIYPLAQVQGKGREAQKSDGHAPDTIGGKGDSG